MVGTEACPHLGYKRRLPPLLTELGLVSRTRDTVQRVLMLYRPTFSNSSTDGYKVAAPILAHGWAPFQY